MRLSKNERQNGRRNLQPVENQPRLLQRIVRRANDKQRGVGWRRKRRIGRKGKRKSDRRKTIANDFYLGTIKWEHSALEPTNDVGTCQLGVSIYFYFAAKSSISFVTQTYENLKKHHNASKCLVNSQ